MADSSGSEPAFCCRGCRFVYETIHQHGLEHYYELRRQFSSDSISKQQREGGHYSYMDDPLFRETFVRQVSDTLNSVDFYLEGVHCAACVWIIERLPHMLEDVVSCRVEVTTARCTLIFNSTLLLSTLASTIDSIGYPPSPFRHGQDESLVDAQNRDYLVRLGVTAVSAANTMLIAVCLYQGYFSGIDASIRQFLHCASLLIALPAVFYGASPFYRRALKGLRSGVLHIDLPLATGILGGFALSVIHAVFNHDHVYFDSICLLIFFLLVGRYLHFRGVQNVVSRAATQMPFLPDEVLRLSGTTIERCFIGSIEPGDEIRVLSSDMVPVDGTLLTEEATLDLSFLTGESYPQHMYQGDRVFAGSRNTGVALELRVEQVGGDTHLSSIIDSSSRSIAKLSTTSRQIDVLGKRFVIIVLCLALGTFIFWFPNGIDSALNVTLAFLVVTCPCALGLSVPTVSSIAMAQASEAGILIRSQDALERLSDCKSVFLDKTGTITSGQGSITGYTCFHDEPDLFTLLFELEQNVSHPIAAAIRTFAVSQSGPIKDNLETRLVDKCILPGLGLLAHEASGCRWILGSVALLREVSEALSEDVEDIIHSALQSRYTPVCLLKDDRLIAILTYGDDLHPDARDLVQELREQGRSVSILSGDAGDIVKYYASQLGIDEHDALGELLPEDKAYHLEHSLCDSAMVGDGVNDAAALSAAHASIGIRGGAESCLSTADVFLGKHKVSDIARCFRGADKAMAVIKRNLRCSLAYNVIGGTIAILGYMDPLVAAILMPISSLTVIVSSISARYYP